MATFYVPENLAGKTLSEIRNEGNYAFRPDVFAGLAGLSEQSPLQTGQSFAMRDDPGAGEYQIANRLFSRTPVNAATSSSTTGGANDVVEQARKLNQFVVEQNQPAVQALQASKQPLQDRYQALLDQIKGNQTTAENRQTVSTKNELARRGIVGGGLYDQSLVDALNPITSQYTNLSKEISAGREADLAALATQIAQLQAGQPANAISSALTSIGNTRSYDLQQQQLAQALQIAQMQNETSSQTAASNRALQEAQLALESQKFNQYTLPLLRYQTSKPYYKPSTGGSGDILGLGF